MVMVIEMAKDKLKDLEIDEIEEIDNKYSDLKENKFLGFLKEFIPYVIILVVVVLIRTYFVTPIIVSGESMNDTLVNGELMILNKRGHIDRYDIVVVKIPREKIIKRVIAMPGETISCENGNIYVNDRKIEVDYGKGVTPSFDKITLADDEYFVLGDNREHSYDSQEFGPVKEDQLLGTTNFVLFPFTRIGTVD